METKKIKVNRTKNLKTSRPDHKIKLEENYDNINKSVAIKSNDTLGRLHSLTLEFTDIEGRVKDKVLRIMW